METIAAPTTAPVVPSKNRVEMKLAIIKHLQTQWSTLSEEKAREIANRALDIMNNVFELALAQARLLTSRLIDGFYELRHPWPTRNLV